ADFSYRIFEPIKKLNSYYIGAYYSHNRLADPGVYTGNSLGLNYGAQTKKLNDFGANLNFEVGKQYYYFEPRTQGRYFAYENRINSNIWYSSNYNKKVAFDASLGGTTYFENNRNSQEFFYSVSPRIRFNDKLLFVYSFNYGKDLKDRGYTGKINDDIIFGERDRKTLTNRITAEYTFNSFHGLSLSFRNDWSTVKYDTDLF